MTDIPISNCPNCGKPLAPGALACASCGRLVYQSQVNDLIQDALRLEKIDPILAAAAWRKCLPLIPPEMAEYHQIGARAAMLSAGMFGAQPQSQGPLNYARPERRPETWASALLKTGGSMALSIAIYSLGGDWQFAVGFVLLILIHELGHTIANWSYGIKQSPPIFLPYVGALIMLRQNPPNAKAEAVIGIAGPIAGTFGAIGCYLLYLYTGNLLLWKLAMYAFGMNLFNLIPIWPLDGGRVAAGITPALWLLGVVAFLAVMFASRGSGSIGSILIALWILQSTLPRIRDVVFRGGMRDAYYRIGAPARLAITFSYLALGGLLFTLALPLLVIWFPVLQHFVRT